MKWNVIDRGKNSAESNMHFDSELVNNVKKRTPPTLHFYDWNSPLCATYGYFIKPEDYFIPEHGDIARRPTGGGIILHGYDFTFSVLIPSDHPGYSVNPLTNYSYINQIVVKSIHSFSSNQQKIELLKECTPTITCSYTNFCMAQPTIYDLIVNGKKAGGAAIRRKKEGYLYQGSLSLLEIPEETVTSLLIDGENLAKRMALTNYPILSSFEQLTEAKEELKKSIIKHFTRC